MDDDTPRWLLRLTEAPESGPLASYLRQGKQEFGVSDRTLVQQRVKAGRKWFEVELHVDAHPLQILQLFPAAFRAQPRVGGSAEQLARDPT